MVGMRVGRPPKRAQPGTNATLTILIPGEVKNMMIDQAVAYDFSITEYLISLIERDVAETS